MIERTKTQQSLLDLARQFESSGLFTKPQVGDIDKVIMAAFEDLGHLTDALRILSDDTDADGVTMSNVLDDLVQRNRSGQPSMRTKFAKFMVKNPQGTIADFLVVELKERRL